jgi:uncharacterized membrane protein YdjX (TVP38/TMEM64 family)
LTPRSTRNERGPPQWWPKVALAALIVGGITAFAALGGPDYLSLAGIKVHRDRLLALTAQHYAQSLLIACAGIVAANALGVSSVVLFSLLCGFLFGPWMASTLVLAGTTVGATLLFLAGRYLFADAVRAHVGPLATRVEEGFERNAFAWLLLLRLTPLLPSFLVTLVPSLTRMRARSFALATALGIAPATLIATHLGQRLGQMESTRDLLEPQTLAIFALLVALVLLPLALRYRRGRGR